VGKGLTRKIEQERRGEGRLSLERKRGIEALIRTRRDHRRGATAAAGEHE